MDVVKSRARAGSRRRRTALAGGVAGLALLAAGCGSGTTPGPSGAADAPRIAVFQPTTTNAYTVTEIQAAADAAKAYGASTDMFNSEFDGAQQASQIRQATASNKYKAFVIMPSANPGTICTAIKDAIAAGIKIAMINQPACNDGLTQADYSAPIEGTSFTGWQTPELLQANLRAGFESSPAGGEYAVIAPTATHQNFARWRTALDIVAKDYPQWRSAGFIPADYLPSTALSKTSALMQSNPNVKLVFSTYTAMTIAALGAIDGAGKSKDVTVVDFASEQPAFDAVKDGRISIGWAALPYEEGYRGVQSAIAQIRGVPQVDGVPASGFIDLTKDPKLGGLSFEITNDNLQQFADRGLPEAADRPDSLKIVNPFTTAGAGQGSK